MNEGHVGSAVDEEFLHASIAGNCERRHQGRCECAEDGGRASQGARLIRKSAKIASWIHMRKEILEIVRTQQYIDSNLVPMQIGVQPKGKSKGKVSRTQGTNRPRK